MAKILVTEVRNVALKDFRPRFLPLLAITLSGRQLATLPEGISLELEIERLTEVIKEHLGLESVEATEVVAEAMDILNNSKITTEIGGFNRHLLVVKIAFPKPEPQKLETITVSGGGVNHDLSENPDT